MRGSGDYDRKKKIQSSFCWVRGSGDYDRKKKDTVVCLTGCAVVLFFVVAGNFDYNRKKKKIQSSVGGKLAVFLLWREIFITTGKKKDALRPEKKRYSRLSDGCAVLAITTGKKKDTVVCLAGCAVVLCQFLVLAGNWQLFCCGGKFLLRPEKKDTVVCLAGARSLLRPEKKRYSRLSVGCAVLAITTGKKNRYSCLSGRLCCCVSFSVVAGNSSY